MQCCGGTPAGKTGGAALNELARAQKDHVSVPEFSRTGIRELDQFASAIVQLSRENEEATALERRRIEHERDYDILTGLYNRQAFQRVCESLFAKPETLGHAALLMTDLDNLKTINDTYGHDWGRPVPPPDGPLPGGQYPAGHPLCPPLGRRGLVPGGQHGFQYPEKVR